MLIIPIIVIVISIVFVTILTSISGKPETKQKNTLNTNFEICFSLGIFISFFLPWVSFTTDNIGLNTFGLDTRSLAELSWAKLVKTAWDAYDLLNQFQRQDSDRQMAFIGTLLFVSLPLIMATINIFLLIAGKVRGWSFYTGIATLLWTGTCLYGYHEVHGMFSFDIGFVVGTCCASCIIISSLITMLFNPKQHLSFVLGHFSFILFGIFIFLLVICMNTLGADLSASSPIPVIFAIFALLLTLVCDYYLYTYLTRRKEELATQEGQSAEHTVTINEHTETILNQHWMYCTKCGTKCKDYLKFCPRCGFALHPEREEPSSEDSSYAPPVRQPEQPECNLVKNDLGIVDKIIPETDNLSRPLVTKIGDVIHVENTVHPTVESHPKPSLVIIEEQKKPSLAFSVKDNKLGMWALIAFAVLLIATIPAYLFWYKPYAIDRDAPRYYTFTNLNLRSSKIADVKHNLLELLPYGTELITYSIDTDWASVKVGKQKGYVASQLILPIDDFELLNSVWGNTDAKECIGTAKYRLAILDYYKLFQMSGGREWQIYTRKKDDRVNTVYYKKLCNRNSKFADFTFIVRNNRTNERELVIYSFDDETEKPIFRKARRLYPHETGNIQSMTSTASWIDILLTDGAWIQIEITGQ